MSNLPKPPSAIPAPSAQPPQALRPMPKATGSAPSAPAATTPRLRFYRSGKIIWSTSDQPNFVPEVFARVRGASQAWHYKLTTLMMIILMCALVYGGFLGYRYYMLYRQQADLQQKLVEAKRKEQEIKKKASEVFRKMASIEKKLSYDSVRQSIGMVLYDIATRLPGSFYVQNITFTQLDDLKTEKNASVSGTRLQGKDNFFNSLKNTITVNGRIIGVGAEATENNLVQNFRSLPGFQITSVKSAGEGIDVNFQYSRSMEFTFTPKPSELFQNADQTTSASSPTTSGK